MDSETELVELRHALLLEQVANDRRVSTRDAAAKFGVSVDTIRRDLRLLHDRGLLRRVHGGAVPVARLPESFEGRLAEGSSQSSALAAEIVSRFKPGQVVGLDGGTTCVEIAGIIPASLAMTVVTNNPAAAVALAGHAHATVILLGGRIDLTWMAATGSDTVDAWRSYRLDIGVVGVCGLDMEAGITTNSPAEVATKRALIGVSADVIIPVQQEKVGVVAPYVVAGLDAVDLVVADAPLPSAFRRASKKAGLQIVTTKRS